MKKLKLLEKAKLNKMLHNNNGKNIASINGNLNLRYSYLFYKCSRELIYREENYPNYATCKLMSYNINPYFAQPFCNYQMFRFNQYKMLYRTINPKAFEYKTFLLLSKIFYAFAHLIKILHI